MGRHAKAAAAPRAVRPLAILLLLALSGCMADYHRGPQLTSAPYGYSTNSWSDRAPYYGREYGRERHDSFW